MLPTMKATAFYKGHRWTNDEIKLLMKLWSEDVDVFEIATALGSTANAIAKMVVRLRREGVPLKRRTKGHQAALRNTPWTQSQIEYLVRRRYQKATAEQVASEIGRTVSAIHAMVQKLRNDGATIPMFGAGQKRLWSVQTLNTMVIRSMPEHEAVDREISAQAI